jgi:hypothetical protein
VPGATTYEIRAVALTQASGARETERRLPELACLPGLAADGYSAESHSNCPQFHRLMEFASGKSHMADAAAVSRLAFRCNRGRAVCAEVM